MESASYVISKRVSNGYIKFTAHENTTRPTVAERSEEKPPTKRRTGRTISSSDNQ
jgi:hypothetical protein